MRENNHNHKKCEICPEATYAPNLGAAYCLDCVVPVCAVSVLECDNKTGSVNSYEYFRDGLPPSFISDPSDKTTGRETTRVCRDNTAFDPCDRVTRSPASPASPAAPPPPLALSPPAFPSL